jgi:selenoprotein W-related protein
MKTDEVMQRSPGRMPMNREPVAPLHAIEIEFCIDCSYRHRAWELAEDLMDRWMPIIERIVLKPSHFGRYEVTLNGELIFSKADLHRHALPGEVVGLVQDRIGAPVLRV